jgi:hypothetical protein
MLPEYLANTAPPFVNYWRGWLPAELQELVADSWCPLIIVR